MFEINPRFLGEISGIHNDGVLTVVTGNTSIAGDRGGGSEVDESAIESSVDHGVGQLAQEVLNELGQHHEAGLRGERRLGQVGGQALGVRRLEPLHLTTRRRSAVNVRAVHLNAHTINTQEAISIDKSREGWYLPIMIIFCDVKTHVSYCTRVA